MAQMLGYDLSEQIPPELPPKKGNNENIIAELNSLKAQLEDQKSINQALEVAKCQVEMKLENACIEHKLVKDQYDDQNQSMTTLKYSLQKVTQERDDSENLVRAKDTTIFELESQISRLQADTKLAKDQYDDLNRSISTLKYNTLQANKDREESEHANRMKDTTIFELESKVSRLQSEISQLKAENDENQRKLLESDVQYQTLVNHHQKELANARDHSDLIKENERLKIQAEKSKSLADQNIRQVKKKNKELNEYLAQVGQANKDLDSAKEQIRQLQLDLQQGSNLRFLLVSQLFVFDIETLSVNFSYNYGNNYILTYWN